jgi:hypothetical protein
MKQKYRLFLLMTCAFAAACTDAKVENAAPNSNTAAANSRNAAGGSVQNSGGGNAGEVSNSNSNANSNTNSIAQPTATAEEAADFAGTAGITDKIFDVKGVAVLREVRAAAHPGFDRVVFEFEGQDFPSYHIEYIDKPVRACGSGNVVPLKGDGWLEIRFTPAAAHTEEGKPTVKDRAQSPNLRFI